MSLGNYEIFDEVVKQKSFIKASEILNLTPSAVSHAISKLEETIGFPLFIRNKSGVQLTNYGEELLQYIRQILKASEYLDQVVSDLNGLNKGTIKIGTFNSVCVNWIPDIIKTFSKLYPNIKCTIFQGGYDDVNNWLKEGTVDLGFITTSYVDDLEVTPLYKDSIMCVLPKSYSPKNQDYVTIDDIKSHNIVCQREGYDAETTKFLKKNGISVNTQFHIEDDQSLVAMVESGFGICLMPELVLRNIQSEVNTYIIKPEEYRIIGIAYLRKNNLSPSAARLHDFIISHLESKNIINI